MLHGQLDRAKAELEAVGDLDKSVLGKSFFDPRDWTATKFVQAAELCIRSGQGTEDSDVRTELGSEGAALADDVLAVLADPRRRARILSHATRLYVLAERVPDARRCLDEYVGALKTGVAKSRFDRDVRYLQAVVAAVEERPYRVIDVLEPEAVGDPSRPEVWRLIAEAYSRTDQTRRSVRALIQYLRLRPRDPKMTLQLAKEYLKLRDWNRAFQTARLAEPLDPADIVIRLLRIEASIYMVVERRKGINTKRLTSLAAELASLRAEHPDRVDIRILQAIIAVYREQPDVAEKELKLAIKECSEPLRAEMQLVRHYYRTKRMDDAVKVGIAACKKHPDVAEPWLALSGVYVAKKQHDEAVKALRQGTESTEGRWEKRAVAIRLAVLELVEGDRAEGIRILRELAEQDKNEIRARSLLFGVLEGLEARAKAEVKAKTEEKARTEAGKKAREIRAEAGELVREIREAQGESGLLWRLYQAALLMTDEDWRKEQTNIAEILQRCIDSDPDWSAPVLLLVDMHQRLGNPGRVEQICREALSRNPYATDIADRLVNLLERQRRFEDAQQVLAKVEANPRVASAWDVRHALRSGDFDRAIDELKLRAANNDQDADSRILLARLTYWKTRNAEQALRYLQEAEAITAGSMSITDARVKILRAENRGQEGLTLLNGQIEEAEQDTETADKTARLSRIFGAYAMRAGYLASIGRNQEAERDYRKLTTIPGREARGYLELGRYFIGFAKPDDAIKVMEEGAKAYPGDFPLSRRWMEALLRRKGEDDLALADSILSKLERVRQNDPDLMRLRAFEYLRRGTPKFRREAQKKLERVVDLEPTSVSAHLALIDIVMRDKKYETARDMAIRAMGNNPDSSRLALARASAEWELGNVQMAAELTRTALHLQPESVEAREVFVDIALRTKDRKLIKEARGLIDKAIEDKPADEQLRVVQTRILVGMGMAETAVAKLEAYCATDEGKKSVAALLALSDLYRIAGETGKSRLRIDQAAKLQPEHPDVISAEMAWLASKGKFDEITKRISAYLDKPKPDWRVTLAAADFLASSEATTDRKQALRLYERLKAEVPHVTEAQLGLASTAYQTGDANRARDILTEVLDDENGDPNNVWAMNDLAWILHEHFREYKKALKRADKGLSLSPGNLNLLDTRGMILSKLGRLVDARKDFEALVELVPAGSARRAKALLQLGRVCVKLNKPTKAKRHFKEAAEIDRKRGVFSAEERSEIAKALGG